MSQDATPDQLDAGIKAESDAATARAEDVRQTVQIDAGDAQAVADPSDILLVPEAPQIGVAVTMVEMAVGSAEVMELPFDKMAREALYVADLSRFTLRLKFTDEVLAADALPDIRRGRVVGDNLLLADDLALTISWKRAFADAVSMQDSLSIVRNLHVSFSDSAVPSDVVTRIVGAVKVDAFNIADVARVKNGPGPNDAGTVSDQIALRISYKRAFAESVDPTDALIVAMAKRITDAASVSDAFRPRWGKGPADAIAPTDTIRFVLRPKLADDATMLDSALVAMRWARAFTDTVTIDDNANTRLPGKIDQGEVAKITDALAKSVTRVRTDAAVATDLSRINARKSFADVAAATDGGVIQFDGGYAEDYFASDYAEPGTINF